MASANLGLRHVHEIICGCLVPLEFHAGFMIAQLTIELADRASPCVQPHGAVGQTRLHGLPRNNLLAVMFARELELMAMFGNVFCQRHSSRLERVENEMNNRRVRPMAQK